MDDLEKYRRFEITQEEYCADCENCEYCAEHNTSCPEDKAT